MTKVRTADRRKAKVFFAIAVAYVLFAAFMLLDPIKSSNGPSISTSGAKATGSSATSPNVPAGRANALTPTTTLAAGDQAVNVGDASNAGGASDAGGAPTKHADGSFHMTGNTFTASGWVTRGYTATNLTVFATYTCSNDGAAHNSSASFTPAQTNGGPSSNDNWSATGSVPTTCPGQGTALNATWAAEVFTDVHPSAAPTTPGTVRVTPSPEQPTAHHRDPLERPSFVTSLPRPKDISWSLKHIAINAGLTFALLLLLGLPAELFNSSYKARHGDKKRRRTRHSWHHRVEMWINDLPPSDLLIGFGVAGALIYAELDPHFGWNQHSALLVGALALAFIVVTSVVEAVRVPYLRRRHKVHAQLEMFPKAFAIAIPLVIISRITGFNPGFIFGVTCGVAVTGELLDEDEGRSIALASTFLLALAIVAWACWVPATQAAAHPNPSNAAVVLDTFLATIWVTGLQVVLFGLLPFRFLYGELVLRWSRTGWAVIYSSALFLFAQVLLHPQSGQWGGMSTTALLIITAVGLVALFAAVSYWLAVRRWLRMHTVIQLPRDEVISLVDLERNGHMQPRTYTRVR